MPGRTIWARRMTGLIAVAGLAACSSAGEVLVVQPVPFAGPVVSNDFIGQTFPVYLALGESGDPTASASTGEGSITYTSATTAVLRLPGRSPVTLTRSGSSALGTSYSGLTDGSDPVTVLISDVASTSALRLVSAADPDLTILGWHGFETPVGDRPATGTYSTVGSVFLTAENVGAFLPSAGSGTLVADFTNNDISGTLLDADPVSVNLAGADLIADDLSLVYELENGQITPDGFRGDVGISAELVVDGTGAPVVLGTNVTGDRVDGRFFGDEAEALAATFDADVRLSDGSGTLVDLGSAGQVSGTRTGP